MGLKQSYTVGAFLLATAGILAIHTARASTDMQPRTNDKACEDNSADVVSPNGLSTARYSKEACDYGFGSNTQNAWVDVFTIGSPTVSKVQILQLTGPEDDLDVIRWRDDKHLEVNVNWPISIKKSLPKAGLVSIIYVAAAPRAFLAHGPDYARFVDWAEHNAESGKVAAVAACSRYKHNILRQPCP